MAPIETYDIVVIGLGAHGSSTLWHLSRTGLKVAGIDLFHPPHQRGSSHGESRIIRQAYHENPLYVPLVRAAYPIWEELGEIAGRPLFQKTGGLFLGSKDSTVVSGARLSADTYKIPYDYLDATAIRNRFPAFRPTDDTVGVLEHEAGILFPEAAIDTFLQAAAANGAQINTDEQVLKISPSKDVIELTTTKGKYRTGKLIVTAGAWLNSLFPELNLPLSIRRQPLFWFRDRDRRTGNQAAAPAEATNPIFLWEYEKNKMFYGIPDLTLGPNPDPSQGPALNPSQGPAQGPNPSKNPNLGLSPGQSPNLKLGWHHGGRLINPDELSQNVEKQEIADMQRTATQYLTIDPVFQKSCVCMYTSTPDEDFIIDFHPQHPRIVIASPCSGHGFKFSAIIGRLLADMALDRPTGFDLTPFSIRRKALTRSPL